KVIAADVAELLRAGLAVSTTQDKVDHVGVIVLTSKIHPYTVIHRANLAKLSKAAIGSVACGLIWGPLDGSGTREPELEGTLVQREITRQLDMTAATRFTAAGLKAMEIKNFLDGYWQKSHRSMSIDSGS